MSAQRVNSRSWRWRGTYFVTLGAAVAALVAGIAYATGGAGFGSATTGSVELGLNAPPPTTTCSYPNLVPGDLPGSFNGSVGRAFDGALFYSERVAFPLALCSTIRFKPA